MYKRVLEFFILMDYRVIGTLQMFFLKTENKKKKKKMLKIYDGIIKMIKNRYLWAIKMHVSVYFVIYTKYKRVYIHKSFFVRNFVSIYTINDNIIIY